MIDQKQAQQISIEIDDQTSQGFYSNLAIISHNETEFFLDFVFVQPQVLKAKVRSRVITSPSHVKRLLKALEENVKHYEQMFGEIKIPQTIEERKIGFYH